MGSYEQVINAITYFNDYDFIEWASASNLIPNIHQQRICNRCGELMKIYFNQNLPDCAVYRCTNNYCSHTLSIRIDSWISKSKLSLRIIARLIACWCEKRTVNATSKDCGINTCTVTKYFQELRKKAEKIYRKDISLNLLGSTNGIIQIDESHFFQAKYNLGKALIYPQLWFFGAIDDKTNKIIIEKCESRSENELLPIICSTCYPGSTI